MQFIRPFGAIVLGLTLTLGAIASAQRGPVAVPIVGSPAAQQPSTPAPQPPQVPSQPPAMPPSAPPAAPPAVSTASTQRKLELTLKDGTVALDAQNVPLREILAEWQRRSGCQFVNAEKLPSAPVTLQFPAGTPELVAIDSMLHGLATATTGYGYIVAPRTTQSAGNSACGAVYILATSRPTSSPTYTPSSVSGPIAAPLVTPGSPDDEIPPVVPFPPGAPPVAQPRPVAMPGAPNVPGQPNPNAQGQQNPNSATNPGATSGFGPVAPTAPGAGRIGMPPATPPQGSGRGGQ